VKRWLLVLAACGSSPKPAPAPSHHAGPAAGVERGLDFERGRGVPRDYRKAVAVYRDACQDGCGDLASCQRLFRLAADDRGIVIAGREMATLAGRLCDRHDMNACIASVLMGLRDETALPHIADKDKQVDTCEAGDLAACQLVMFGASFNFGGSSAVEEREQRAAQKACTLGDADGCNTVAKHWQYECGGKDLLACIDARAAETRAEMTGHPEFLDGYDRDMAELRDAVKRTITACTDGDVDACAAIDHDVPKPQLCDAGDLQVCEVLAKEGDDHAKQIACAAGIDVGCAIKVPPRIAPRDYAQSLLFLREQCTKMKNQQACDLLAKESAPQRCR
jgi:hypothetical protein